LFLCYAYLRWVDNYIDNPAKTFSLKKEFIELQLKLVNSISSEIETELHSNEEVYLYYYILFAIKNKKSALINDLKNIMESLRMDIYRIQTNGVFVEKDLESYIRLSYCSMFNLVHSFVSFDDDTEGNYSNLKGFLWYGGTFRDFYKDFENGYLNISKEDYRRV
jgi:chaperonin cofactor prefoldin